MRLLSALLLFTAILFMAFSGFSQVLISGTSFQPTHLVPGKFAYDIQEVVQFGSHPSQIGKGYPSLLDAGKQFSGGPQYAVTDSLQKLNGGIFEDINPGQFKYIVSSDYSKPVTLFYYQVSDLVPGSIVTISLDMRAVIDTGKFTCGYKGPFTYKLFMDGLQKKGNVDVSLKPGTTTWSKVERTDTVSQYGTFNFSIVNNQDGLCGTLAIGKVEVYGFLQPKLVRPTLGKVCAGDHLTINTAFDYNYRYNWQEFQDNEWTDVDTNKTLEVSVKKAGNAQYRVVLKALDGSTVATSETYEISVVNCCTPDQFDSLTVLYYNDFGVHMPTDPAGSTFLLWDYDTNPFKPVQRHVVGSNAYRFNVYTGPVGLTYTAKGPLLNGYYTAAAYLTGSDPYKGIYGALLGSSNNVGGAPNAPVIAYDHSGTLDGACLFLNYPSDSYGKTVYNKTVRLYCVGKDSLVNVEIFYNTFSNYTKGLNFYMEVTGGFDTVKLNSTVLPNSPEWSRAYFSLKSNGTINMQVKNIDTDTLRGTLVLDDLTITTIGCPRCETITDDETKALSEQKVFPNPVVDQLNFTYGSGLYEIYNCAGILIQSGKANGSIDVESLQKGMYFLRLIGEEGSINHAKFVKE